MDTEIIMLMIMSVVFSLGYGLAGFIKAKIESGESWNWMKFAVTAVYSIFLGVVMVYLGIINLDSIDNFAALIPAVWAQYLFIYTAALYFFEKILVPVVITRFASKTIFYPKSMTVDPNRKMDAETRAKFFTDQPEQIKAGILRSVDIAESKQTWRYAVEAGAWIYLVEFGEVFGAKHYYFKQWFGTSDVNWKPCTVECFDTAKLTGRIPEFGNLY